MRFLAVALLCLVPLAAEAKQSPNPPVTPFKGDRYAATAQLAGDVARAVKAKRAGKPIYLYPTRKRPPATRQRWQHDIAGGLSQVVGRALARPAAWCGWWLGQHLGMPDRRLWLARNWASVGSNAGGPQLGAVVVWRHHVGIITGRQGERWVVKSGNDGRRVRERPRSLAGAIAFRLVRG